jgi:redox-sensitive bicupin YhaK (pirin superfamily)
MQFVGVRRGALSSPRATYDIFTRDLLSLCEARRHEWAAMASLLTSTHLHARPVVARTRGCARPGGVRLVSPAELGDLVKPFVLVDVFDVEPAAAGKTVWQAYSGIAAVTILCKGKLVIEETAGHRWTLGAGSVGWLSAGGGAWRSSMVAAQETAAGFHLWVALGPEAENGPAQSCYLNGEDVSAEGPARVVWGRYGQTVSRVPPSSAVNCLDVSLKAGERWTYQPPTGHIVGWIAVQAGAVCTPELVTAGALAVFAEESAPISIEALYDSRFVLGSAVKHQRPLVPGRSSVHTTREALSKAEIELERIREVHTRCP